MSIDFRSIREIANDPFGRLLAQLSKKLSASLAKDQADLVDNPEDIYADGQDIESKLTYQNFVTTKKFDLETEFFSPAEPDHDLNKIWLQGSSLGNQVPDISGFDNIATLYGDPILVNGTPFSYGIHDSGPPSIARRFNRPTSDLENSEYMVIPHNANFQVSGIATGISYFIRFRVFDLAAQGSFTRTLLAKYDDANNGVLIQFTSDGRLVFIIKRAGTEYRVRTAASTITTDTVYETWLTYANSGNVSHIYVNNSDKSLTDPGAPAWPTETTNMKIMARTSTNGFVYGDFYDLMVMRERVVSAAEVGFHFINKVTTADIPLGQVMISDYWCSNTVPLFLGDFEHDSFEADSFKWV